MIEIDLFFLVYWADCNKDVACLQRASVCMYKGRKEKKNKGREHFSLIDRRVPRDWFGSELGLVIGASVQDLDLRPCRWVLQRTPTW